MANNWRLLKAMNDIDEAIAYMHNNKESIEILMWDEDVKQAHVSKIKANRSDICAGLNNALAWRPSEDEEKFKKFLAKLDADYDAYVLEFSGLETLEQQHATSAAIRESLNCNPLFNKADYFVFEIIGYVSKVVILLDHTMHFDIPAGFITRIQKTSPSFAAHDNDCFIKALKKHREKLEKRFFLPQRSCRE